MAKALTVSGYKDNPNGTTTTTLSDGSSNTGRYTKNKDGSLTFNLDTLTSPVKPMSVPSLTPSSGTAGLSGMIESSSDAFTKGLAEKSARAEANKDNSLEALISSTLNSPGETALTDSVYSKEGGVDDLEGELKDINQQMLEEQNALRKEKELILKNGGSEEVANNIIRQKERDSLSKQADLAIIQLSRQGKYDSAKAIADRAVSVKMEETTQRNALLKLIYDDNKDDFTTAEQRQFETAQADRETKAQNEEYRLRAEYDQKIQQSDPKYQLELQKLRQDVANGGANANGTLNGKPQTVTQAQVQGYAERTATSSLIIDTIGSQFTGASSALGSMLWNPLKSTERQQYEQAQRNFVNAVLRRESGAVISEEEFANARVQYFPQPGDKPEVVVQKAQNREAVINSLYKQSNVPRSALPGQVVEDGEGNRYEVGLDGEELIPI